MSEPVLEPHVFIVDDDTDMRDSLKYLIRSVGLHADAFSSAREFLQNIRPEQPGCLILDVRMPEISGLELQEELLRRGIPLPVIIISAHADVPMAIRAIKSGAMEFLEKPFSVQVLLERVQKALGIDRQRRRDYRNWLEMSDRMASLTAKEAEALELVLDGAPNKAIASRLKIAERTVELRRSSVMKKLDVNSVAELVRRVVEFRQSPFCSEHPTTPPSNVGG